VAIHGTSPTSVRAFGEGDTLEGAAQEISKKSGSEVIAVHGDLTDEAVVHTLAEQIRSHFGKIDILINCAGGDIGAHGTSGPEGGKPQHNDAVFIALDDIKSVLDRNLMTCILTCREVAPEMMERKTGVIVNFGSIAGTAGKGKLSIYCTAKAAVHQYSRCLADQLKPFNVRVNVVAPGEITSPRFKASRVLDEARLTGKETLDRYGTMEEVAKLVEFFVSDDNSYVTGQVIRIDGGLQLFPA
jgi:3-oxoacyl-[acyl-carrier protein] reductase